MKTYIKPIMESEAFVANEFVSACYYLDCTNCDAIEFSKTQYNLSGYDNVGGQGQDIYMYTGKVNGVDTCSQVGGDVEFTKPGWINGISDWLPVIGWLVEGVVWEIFKDRYSHLTETINYHPVRTGMTDKKINAVNPNISI